MRYDYYIYTIMLNTESGPFKWGPYEFRYKPVWLDVGCDNQDELMLYDFRGKIGPQVFTERFFDGLTAEQAETAKQRMMAEIGTLEDDIGISTEDCSEDGTNSEENKYPYDWTGRTQTAQHRKNISDSLKGHVYPESRNKKISESMKGISSNVGNTNRALSWLLESPTGEIKLVTNLAKFCEGLGLDASNLRQCADGLRQHHKGYRVRRGNFLSGWNK